MNSIVQKLIKTFTSDQFKKYFISGITAFGTDYIILNILTAATNDSHIKIIVNLSVPNLISTFFGMIVSYILNRLYAFKSNKDVVKEGSKFILVVSINYIVSNILFGFMVYNIKIIAPIAKIFVVGLQMLWTYFLYKFFVFKDPTIIVSD